MLLIRVALAVGRIDDLFIVIDRGHRSLHVYFGALCLKRRLIRVKQSLRSRYLFADPECHTAAQETDVAVGIKGDHLFILIIIQDCVERRRSRMICPDYYNSFFHVNILLFMI